MQKKIKKNKGRPRKLCPTLLKNIALSLSLGKEFFIKEVQQALIEDFNITISCQSLQRNLKEAGLKAGKRKCIRNMGPNGRGIELPEASNTEHHNKCTTDIEYSFSKESDYLEPENSSPPIKKIKLVGKHLKSEKRVNSDYILVEYPDTDITIDEILDKSKKVLKKLFVIRKDSNRVLCYI
ncbi:hypothetical protein BB559_000591 [Furculomyces boomerangus]|uniref:Uncharacterized protein n=1 Tax=Furculomyces boomerangus TaxID=61424 RepID=A0A2T9Z4R4_9FUNG|nr:hypothetical protein BB559_000591 [Furculomyces boomerangus]